MLTGEPGQAESSTRSGLTKPASTTGLVDDLALIAFSTAVVLSPFRARIVLVERSNPPIYRDYTDFLLFWSDIAVLATLVLWGASRLRRPRSIRLGPFFLRWPAAVLLALAWTSSITSADRSLSLYVALRLSMLAALALFVINEIDDWRVLRPALAIMVFVQAIAALGQNLSQGSIGWQALGEHDLDPAVEDISTVTTLEGDVLLRAYGLADHPNILGGMLVFGVLALIGSLTAAREPNRTVATVVVGIGAVAAALSFSRGAAVAAAVSFAVGCLLLARRRLWPELRWWMVAAAAGALVVSLTIFPYMDFYTARTAAGSVSQIDSEERSLSARQDQIRVTNELIIDRPFLGTGVGAVTVAMKRSFSDLSYYYQPAHFVLLTVTAETGLLGGLAYSALMIGPWLVIWRRRSGLDPPLIGASAVLAAVTIVGLFDYYTWSYAPGQLWFWMALGIWGGSYEAIGDG